MNDATITTYSSKKNRVVIGAVILALIAAVFILGPSAAFSYYYNKGAAALDAGDFKNAKSFLEKSLRFGPNRPEPYVKLGRVAFGPRNTDFKGPVYPEARYKEAVEYFEKALSLGLNEKHGDLYWRTLENMGHAYGFLGDNDRADERHLLSIPALEGNSGRIAFIARYKVALDYFNRLNKPGEALELLLPAAISAEDLRSRNKDNINTEVYLMQVNSLLARLYSYFEGWENAERYASSAVAIAPTDSRDFTLQAAHVVLSRIAGINKKFGEAEKEIKKANELAGKNNYDCFLADAYFWGEDYKQAVTAARNADKSGVFISFCSAVLGKAYAALGNKTEARQNFEKYLSLTENVNPKNSFLIKSREDAKTELEKLK